MNFELDQQHEALRASFAAFFAHEVSPFANQWDREERIPETLVPKLAEAGFLGAGLPKEYGGQGWDQLAVGLLHEECGRACSSVRSLLTVHHSLVGMTVERWGSAEQRASLLPKLANGDKIAAFCLSEPDAGSDAQSIRTVYTEDGDSFVLNGVKKWTTFGQWADVFLVVANSAKGISTFLVDRNLPGVVVKPLSGMLGTTASLLAEIHFSNVEVPAGALLGRKGMGFLQIVNTALDHGRFSVGCGSLGIARACLEDSIHYAQKREQFGQVLLEHQLIRKKITDMVVAVKAARLLCYQAANLRDRRDPNSIIQTSLAKYQASVAANDVAREAVQIFGAAGCHSGSNVQRYFRDAKIMEIIEGSSEIQQQLIAGYAGQNLDTLMDT